MTAYVTDTQPYPGMPYEEYLNTHTWRTLRRRARRAANYRCLDCGRDERDFDDNPVEDKWHVHHNRYPTTLGTEGPDDLVLLCPACHSARHGDLTGQEFELWVRKTAAGVCAIDTEKRPEKFWRRYLRITYR